ncbi:MAG: hypothetical protein INH41_05150 [Myxococcaceae bacterium]|jgi:23S rRNA G2445 N2-methylase RlmL|nr:hypothetical protein [Myxococcaceae bacterium]MCA3011771.1 hypothetical protein [Myxococcaceae bacterium]
MAETCFVGCTPGLEQALAEELEALGVRATVTTGGCDVTGPEGSFVRLNVQSRLASRVLLRLGHARAPAALGGVPVRRLVGASELTLAVTAVGRVTPAPEVWRREAARAWGLVAPASAGRGSGGAGPEVRGVAVRAEGAAAMAGRRGAGRSGEGQAVRPGGPGRGEAVRMEGARSPAGAPAPGGSARSTALAPSAGGLDEASGGGGPETGLDEGALRVAPARAGRDASAADELPGPLEVSLRLDASGALVSVDTSGALLYLRGARQETGKAPLRETLAAGVLRLCGWAPPEPLWDVMCGSGTLVLEAAEQALGLQPGRQRTFAFERFAEPRAEVLARVREKGPAVPTWIRGSDLNAGALGVARRNARRAGVLEAVQLERLDATALRPPATPPGLVLANLPYGKRVGSRFELAALYARLGRALKQALPGWRFGFLLQDGVDVLGLEVTRSVPVKNGGLSCLLVTGRL